MALIECNDCSRTVSESAVSCPNCGAPIAGRGSSLDAGTPRTTIQNTSKNLKALTLVGWAIMVLSVSYCSFTPGNVVEYSKGFQWFAAGLGWIIIMKIIIWWNHG
jgi:hypothetical protein